MNGLLLLRYFIEMLLLVPTAAFALLPVHEHLRAQGRRHTGGHMADHAAGHQPADHSGRGFSLHALIILCVSLGILILGCSLLGAKLELPLKYLFLVSLPLYFPVYLRLVDLPLTKVLFCYFNAVLLTAYCLLYTAIACAPLELGNPHNVSTLSSGLFCLALAVVLVAIFLPALTKKLPYLLTVRSLDSTWRVLLLAPLLLSILFLYVSPRSVEVVMTGRVRITCLLFLVLVPLAFLLLYHMLWRIVSQLEENAHLRETQELMKLETKRYEELRDYMKQTRALRHDFRQHLLAIDRFASSGDTDGLSDYIREFIDVVSDHHVTLCANSSVDAIAAHYDSIAAQQQTEIGWDLQLPEKLPVREADFCGIFGNLVENALNAVAQLPNAPETDPPMLRHIQVSARMLSDEMLGLTVRNPYLGELSFDENGLPISSRPDHGVGMSSVQATVEKYNGALQIDASDAVFTASILLCCQPTATAQPAGV